MDIVEMNEELVSPKRHLSRVCVIKGSILGTYVLPLQDLSHALREKVGGGLEAKAKFEIRIFFFKYFRFRNFTLFLCIFQKIWFHLTAHCNHRLHVTVPQFFELYFLSSSTSFTLFFQGFFEVATHFFFGASGVIIYKTSSPMSSIPFLFKLLAHMSIINGGGREI